MTDLNQLIASAVKESGADDSIKSQLTESLKKELSGYVNLELLKTKLEVLYNFEKTIWNSSKNTKRKSSLLLPCKKIYVKSDQNSSLKH